mmetsp:Transcript_4790/g.5536  ORF Transcript_4790/g.5536 Transcript_4790/m.5536 type:complete len:178 (+) Transcript_4790:80-613(+)
MIDITTYGPEDDVHDGWPTGPDDAEERAEDDLVSVTGGNSSHDKKFDKNSSQGGDYFYFDRARATQSDNVMPEEHVWATTAPVEEFITGDDADGSVDSPTTGRGDYDGGDDDDLHNSKPEGWLLVEQGPGDSNGGGFDDDANQMGYYYEEQDETDPSMDFDCDMADACWSSDAYYHD